jgi:ABC-type uncharacterized transport system permease subunit
MNRRLIPYLLLAGMMLGGLSITLEVPMALRVPVMLAVLLLVPGLSFVPLLRLPQKGYELTLAVALSLLLEALIGTVLVELQRYSLELSLEVLGSLSLIGCGLQIWWPAEDQTDPLEQRLDEEADERDWVAQ